jgi:hypothetical protein
MADRAAHDRRFFPSASNRSRTQTRNGQHQRPEEFRRLKSPRQHRRRGAITNSAVAGTRRSHRNAGAVLVGLLYRARSQREL